MATGRATLSVVLLAITALLVITVFAPVFAYPRRWALVPPALVLFASAPLAAYGLWADARARDWSHEDQHSFDTAHDGEQVLRVPARGGRPGPRVRLVRREGYAVDLWPGIDRAGIRVRFDEDEVFPLRVRPSYIPPCGAENAWTGPGCLADGGS